MKHIIKGVEPADYTEWKTHNAGLARFDDAPKKSIKGSLMIEQGYICCYCERRLVDNDSHIEHFVPQCETGCDPFDYDNMLCSCQNRLTGGEPRHCAVLKGNWYDPALLVSPLDPVCESRFAYLLDGSIKPARIDDDGARVTIDKLGLGINKLKDLRAKAIEPFLDEELSNEEFQSFVAAYLQRDAGACFGEFFTSIKYLFGGLVAA